MKLYDIHTHQPSADEQIVSIVNNIVPPSSENFSLAGGSCQSVGIHPWYIGSISGQLRALETVLETSSVVAVGELGLDRLAETPMDKQIAVFNEQIRLATSYCLPLIIHCVKAWDELLKIKKQSDTFRPWIIHGFRGKEEQAVQLIRAGFFLSFGPYYHVEALRKAYPYHLLLETDNSGFSIRQIYQKVAADLNLNRGSLAENVAENVRDIFGI